MAKIGEFYWTLRDTLTGEWYAGVDYYARSPRMTLNLAKSKKCKDIGNLKSSILSFSGYFDNLPGSDNLPEWIGGPRIYDLPSSWEAVKINKALKIEVETQEIQCWYKRTWELRSLTMLYGSSVRTAYGKAEKKGLENYSTMLVFSPNIDPQDDLSEEDIQDINSVIEDYKGKRGDLIKAKNTHNVSYVFKNKTSALMTKLSYGGDLKVTALDLHSLKEIVDSK